LTQQVKFLVLKGFQARRAFFRSWRTRRDARRHRFNTSVDNESIPMNQEPIGRSRVVSGVLAVVASLAVLATASVAAPQDAVGAGDVKSLHVQGNVWMLVAGSVNAAIQIGDDGVLVVDTMTEPLADKMLTEIRRLAGGKPIRYIVNTHVHADHTGGNEKIAGAGQSIVAGNFAGQVGQDAANLAAVIAH